MMRKDQSYRVVAQYISASPLDLVRVTEFSYEGELDLPWSSDVLIRDAQTLRSSMHFEYDSKGRTIERVSKDENGVQVEKVVYMYSGNNVIRQDTYAGGSADVSYSVITGYDNHWNTVYTRDPEGAECFYSYANTNSQNQFVDSKGAPVNLFSNQFYANIIPTNCHTLLVGQAFINNGKVTETYHRYDTKGNLIETKTLFPTRNYRVFSGTFDEPGQTTFQFDLTGLSIVDGIIIQLLMLLLLVWSPPIIDNKHIVYYRADPHGTGWAANIRRTTLLHYNGTTEYEIWEIVNADGSTTLVAEFFYDREGHLKEGSWKWENGVYYVWVVGDNGEGAWVPSEPPPDRQPPP